MLIEAFLTPLESAPYTAKKVFRLAGGINVNLPNALTLLRIFIVPLLVVVLLTPFSESWFGVP